MPDGSVFLEVLNILDCICKVLDHKSQKCRLVKFTFFQSNKILEES